MSKFSRNIRPYVDVELQASLEAELKGQIISSFSYLERAHVLGQASTKEHVRVHWNMFLWGIRQRNFKECIGQIIRIVGAATKTAIGLVPHGNTGGSNVSPFKPMPIPSELADRIKSAHSASP